MAKQMQIIGKCAFCQREVGSDMRPINQLNMDNIEILANKLNDCLPSTSIASGVETIKAVEQTDSKATVESTKAAMDPVSVLTEAMLTMVKEQFESVPVSESQIPEDNAELIMAMLSEEHNTYNKYLNKKKATKPQAKRRKQ